MVPNGWTAGKVSDVIQSLESGVSVNGEDRQLNPKELGVLKVSAVSYGYFNPIACKAINVEEIPRAKINPKKGQVIISRSNTPELVGASAYIDKDYSHLFLPDKLWQTIPKPNQNMKWLSYVLALPSSRYYLSDLATGTSSSMKNITQEAFLSLKILIPSVPEQQKIAEILSTWDKAIEKIEELISNSQVQKRALMQQLLTSKKRLLDENGERFSGKWEKVLLKNLCNIQTGKKDANEGTEKGKYPFFTCAKNHIYCDNHSFDCEAILIAGNGAIGTTHYYNGKFEAYQRTYVLNDFNTVINPLFLLYFINYWLHIDIKREQQRGAMPYIRVGLLQNFKVSLPSILEQEKIISVLSCINQEVKNLENKLEYLKQEKKALMQQLLTGKRRVTIN